MGFFYKAVVQAVLLYGSESWVLSDGFLARLNAFHHRIACNITGLWGRPDPRDPDEWIYPDMEMVLEKAGLHSIETYIQKRKHTVLTNYVQPHSLWYRSCLANASSVSPVRKKNGGIAYNIT